MSRIYLYISILCAICTPLFASSSEMVLSAEELVKLNLNEFAGYASLPQQQEIINGKKVFFITVPKGFKFYKAMPKTKIDNGDISNIHATTPSWYADMMTAMKYVASSKEWGLEGDAVWEVHAYVTTRQSKLLRLSNLDNLEFLVSAAEKQLLEIDEDLQKLQSEKENVISPSKIAHLQRIIVEQKMISSQLSDQLHLLKISTGYHITWEQQLEGLETLSRKSKHRIEMRKNNLKKAMENELFDENSLYGPGYNQLNRISFSFHEDSAIFNIIQRYLNVDGFFNPTVPSLWHLSGEFQPEIGFIHSRGLLERDFDSPFDWTNKEHSHLYQRAIHLSEEAFLKKLGDRRLLGRPAKPPR